MKNLEQMKAPRKALILPALSISVGLILSACADNVEKCLGKSGEGEKDRVAKLVSKCDQRVDEHSKIDNDDISRNPGVDARAFNEATQACREASYEAAKVHRLLVLKKRTLSREKKGVFDRVFNRKTHRESCSVAIEDLEKMGQDVISDAKRLHANDF